MKELERIAAIVASAAVFLFAADFTLRFVPVVYEYLPWEALEGYYETTYIAGGFLVFLFLVVTVVFYFAYKVTRVLGGR